MITMDMKGISWVGNVYQKFEAMCLEVEENIYQDTVKYVENQVQTVGSTVKKFYSDVMQDLLPPSSVDATKDGVYDLPLELYADVGIYMKPKVAMKEKHTKVDNIEKLTEDPKMIIHNKFSGHSPTFRRLNHVDSSFPLSQGDSPEGDPGQYGKGSLSNKPHMGTKKIRKRVSLNEKSGNISPLDKDLTRASSFYEPSNENLGDCAEEASNRYGEGRLSNKSNLGGANKNSKRENMLPSERSGIITPLDKDLTGGSSVCKFSNENHKASSDQNDKIATLGSVEVTGHESIEESKIKTENASEQMPDIQTDASDIVNLKESGMSEETDMRTSSCCSSLQEANAADVCMNDGLVSLEVSYANGRVQRSKIACEEDFASDSEIEIVQPVHKAKLEESCVMVNRDELRFVPQNGVKSKSYRIQDVFLPRKRSVRKKEQLPIWPGNDSNPNQEESIKNSMPSLIINDARRSPTADCCESEWELL
ncbi:uncharacterized protein LOC110629977 isoform X2 [Manihot esculenta]|uniref:uncharacterized protein LOC110629977 isoform X2 n=1 Tax=Manihot esculenta TaxID=3983 RepID=UPI001CC65CBB|nr:uncharacterized protein LOC110629977 isoform X2 [Manihot esculenta]